MAITKNYDKPNPPPPLASIEVRSCILPEANCFGLKIVRDGVRYAVFQPVSSDEFTVSRADAREFAHALLEMFPE